MSLLTLNIIFWAATLSLAVGLGMGMHALIRISFDSIDLLVKRLPTRSRLHRLEEIGLVDKPKEDQCIFIKPAVEKVRQQASFPVWITIAVAIATLIGFVITKSFLAFAFVIFYLVVRMWINGYYKRKENKDVWLFLLDLRTKLTLKGSLLTAMQELAVDGRTTTSQIIRVYLESGYQGSGLRLLRQVSDDTKLPFLDEIVSRAEASAQGKLSLDQALRQAIELVQEEIDVSAREQLQKVPSRLIIFVFPMLLGPGLVIILYPVVASMLDSLRSMSGT